jgi:hypothetical protein
VQKQATKLKDGGSYFRSFSSTQFNPSTVIEFVARQSGSAKMKLFAALRQEVAAVFEEKNAEAGRCLCAVLQDLA